MGKTVICFIILISLAGCEFSPSGSNFVVVDKEISPIQYEISVSQSFSINDTTKVHGYLEINYKFDIGNKHVFERRAWIDYDKNSNNWMLESGLEGSLPLNTTNYSDGLHHINFKIITSSGRESIVAQFGEETLETEVSIPLWFDNSEATPVSIQHAELTSNGLKLTWSPYHRSRFYNYVLYRELYYPNGVTVKKSQVIKKTEPFARDSVTAVDSTYEGGKAVYRLAVNADKYHDSSLSEPFEFDN